MTLPLPPSVTTVPVHIKIGKKVGDEWIPASGSVTFSGAYELRDTTGKVIAAPPWEPVKLDAGGEGLVSLIDPNDSNISPSGWAYTVYIATNVLRATYQIQIPANTPQGITLELSDLGEAVTPPPVVTYALDSAAVHKTGNETIAGVKTFTSSPTVPAPSAATDAASKGYVDSGDTAVASAAATDASSKANAAQAAAITAAATDATTKANAAQTNAIAASAQRASNLSDLTSASSARSNLGLGGAATLNVGTNAGTVAAGDDSRIVGALQKTAFARNIRDFGVLGNGSEEGAAIQSAITAILGLGADVYLPPGTYKSNSALSWDPTKGSVFGVGQVVLDFTGLASGYAITLNCADSSAAFRAIEHEALRGVRILGPQSDTTTADGIKFTGSANSSQIGLSDVSINGFRDQAFFDVNTWCTTFNRVVAGHWARYALNFDATTNAGENYNFYGCTFYNSTNATTGTATAVYTSPTGNADVAFHSCSFDYNDYSVLHQGGMLSFFGCHFEGNNANPFIQLTRTSDPLNPRTTLSLFGGAFVQTEAGNGRDHLIEVLAGAVNGVRLSMNGVQFQTFGRTTTVFKNLSATSPRVSHVGCDLDNTGSSTQSANMGQYTNLLVNGDFESSTAFGASAAFPLYPGIQWTKGGTLTYSFDATVFRTGTRSLKIVGTGVAVGSNLQQMIAVIPGRELLVTLWVKAVGLVGGNTFCRVSWYLGDYTTRTVVAYQSAQITTDQDWTAYATQLNVPPGITAALIDVVNTNLNGTVYVDDVCATMP